MTFATTNAALIRKVADEFAGCSIGGYVKYAQLSRAIGEPIQQKLYLAYRGMKLANKETGAIFRNERGVGYQRMPAEETHSVGKRARLRGKRIFSAAAKSMTNSLIFANDMSNDARKKAFSEQAAIGLLIHLTYDRNVPKIEDIGSAPPSPNETVRASMEAIRAARESRAP